MNLISSCSIAAFVSNVVSVVMCVWRVMPNAFGFCGPKWGEQFQQGRLGVLLQSFMFAVYEEASQNIQNATGPIDDGYITNVVGALPGDALCCAGPEALDDGMLYAVPAVLPEADICHPACCVVYLGTGRIATHLAHSIAHGIAKHKRNMYTQEGMQISTK